VSDTLGAFMARAIVLENAELFPLDKELNESDVQELIRLATERLLDRDSPSLETVKMQARGWPKQLRAPVLGRIVPVLYFCPS
jgi:hypothetical protein